MPVTRDSGIPLVGRLPWGTHFCQFHHTKEDMLQLVVPYIKAGLEGDELCVWVTTDLVTTGEALAALAAAVPDLAAYRGKGQLELLPYRDWYLRGGKFDLHRTLDLWSRKHEQALARGLRGLRVTGSPHWIDNKKDWRDFTAYEAEISRAIRGKSILVMCTYDFSRCGVGEIIDVLQNHEFSLAMRRGEWEIMSLPAHVPVEV